MSTDKIITSTRNLPAFKNLDLCDSTNWADLIISSGDQEELVISGPAGIVSRIQTRVENETLIIRLGGSLLDKVQDALTTSLTRKKITYHLTVSQLESIELCGLIRLDTSGLESGKPFIRQLNPWAIPVRISPPIRE